MKNDDITKSFLRLRTKLKAVASSILKNDDDADDALQEAFCRLWKRGEEVKSANADGVVSVTVKRICIDLLRSRSAHPEQAIDDDSDRAADNSEESMNDSFSEFKEKLLAQLPVQQREAFEMYGNGIDYDIIAMRLGISGSAARQSVCRARKRLRIEYNKLK